MNKVMIFIDLKDLMATEYSINMSNVRNCIMDHLFDISGINYELIRTYMFSNTNSNLPIDIKTGGYEIICPKFDLKDNNMPILMSTTIIPLAYHNAFDIAVIVSGDINMIPCITEIRKIGKRVLLSCFEDRANNIYRYENNPTDYDPFFLDESIDNIAMETQKLATIDSILEDMNASFLSGNIDYNSIRIKKYLTYWAVRARFIQTQISKLTEEQQDILRRTFDKLNDLSSQYKPGYVKALNRTWEPDSWEAEIRRISSEW